MNRGWKRGTDQVSSPVAAENFNSPTSPWTLAQIQNGNQLFLKPWQLGVVNANVTAYLPPNPAIGDQVAVCKFGVNEALTVAIYPGSRHTINGISNLAWTSAASGGTQAAYGLIVFWYVSQNLWVVLSSTGSDAGMSFAVDFITVNSGTNTASAASVTTPTLGAAAKLSSTNDLLLYIVIGTAGTAFTIAIGPTSGVANTIVNSVTATSGTMYTVRLPAGWYIAVSGTTATWTTTAIAT
jgi:hypothetical protein